MLDATPEDVSDRDFPTNHIRTLIYITHHQQGMDHHNKLLQLCMHAHQRDIALSCAALPWMTGTDLLMHDTFATDTSSQHPIVDGTTIAHHPLCELRHSRDLTHGWVQERKGLMLQDDAAVRFLHVGMLQHDPAGRLAFLHRTAEGKFLPQRDSFRRFHLLTVPLSPSRAAALLGGLHKHMGYDTYQVLPAPHQSGFLIDALAGVLHPSVRRMT